MGKIGFNILFLFLFFLQILFTLNSNFQIRYEELAESVRNVYWLQNHTIYDGVSSNVGWYGTLLLIYNFFGFTLHTAKFYRLILAIISLICLASILKKYLGTKWSIIPLLTIGLSPTLLFFNTLQTSYGTDLQYLPICLWLVITINFKRRLFVLLQQAGLWILMMIAWMSYPTFLFYIPILGVFYLYQLMKQSPRKWFPVTGNLLLSLLSFLMPLLTAFLYVKDKPLLWFDPVSGGGIFRGAGIMHPDLNIFVQNIRGMLNDLFAIPGSYYYEVALGDFSNSFPILAVLLVLFLSLYLTIKVKNARIILLLILFTMLVSLFVSNIAFDPSGYPGIRRNTPLLASFYALFTFVWYAVVSKKWGIFEPKKLLIGLMLIIPVHHLLIYPINLMHMQEPSRYQYSLMFNIAETPEKSLDLFVKKSMHEELELSCQDKDGKLITCRYSEIYPVVSGTCYWNSLKCNSILGYDDKLQKYIPLSISLWEKYYWPH